MRSFFREINFGLIVRIIGFLLMVEGAFMLSAVPVEWHFSGRGSNNLLISGIVTLISGALFFFSNAQSNKTLGKREGYIIVTFSWIFISLFGSLPYYLGADIPLFTNAFFETISGFTTTGASILTDVEAMPKGLLYWRSLTHWIGGMGIIVLSVAILPILGIGGMQLFMAEMPGITYDKLHPRITSTAKRLWAIYVLLTAMQFFLLWAGEMDWFEAICHSYSTMATGGFGTRNNSVAAFGAYSQYVIILFMFLAGTNFTLHYFALHGQLKKAITNEEFKGYVSITVIVTLIAGAGLYLTQSLPAETAFRDSLFTVVSILTTTGFATADYLLWPVILWVLIFLLMFIGGSAGSTGGGMKIIRQMLLLKNSYMELRRSIHPNAVLPVKFNGKSVPQDVIYKVMAFFLMYILLFVIGVLFLAAIGIDFETAIGASIACLGNIGPGIGLVGPVENFSFMPDAAKWFLSLLMLLGRLELFTVLILFSPHFWRK
jgi:trk system potassium uptake protein